MWIEENKVTNIIIMFIFAVDTILNCYPICIASMSYLLQSLQNKI